MNGRPYRPHGPILPMEGEGSDPLAAWAARFNARCTIAAVVMLGVIGALVGWTSL